MTLPKRVGDCDYLSCKSITCLHLIKFTVDTSGDVPENWLQLMNFGWLLSDEPYKGITWALLICSRLQCCSAHVYVVDVCSFLYSVFVCTCCCKYSDSRQARVTLTLCCAQRAYSSFLPI